MEVRTIKTWAESKGAKGFQMISVTDDVQNVVRDLKGISDRLHVYVNEQTGHFDVVESCIDGTDRLVCTVEELDQRVVERVRAADHWYGRDTPDAVLPDEHDFASQVDRDNAALEARMDEEARERIRDAAERIHWALDLGPGQHSPGGQISLAGRRKRNRFG